MFRHGFIKIALSPGTVYNLASNGANKRLKSSMNRLGRSENVAELKDHGKTIHQIATRAASNYLHGDTSKALKQTGKLQRMFRKTK